VEYPAVKSLLRHCTHALIEPHELAARYLHLSMVFGFETTQMFGSGKHLGRSFNCSGIKSEFVLAIQLGLV